MNSDALKFPKPTTAEVVRPQGTELYHTVNLSHNDGTAFEQQWGCNSVYSLTTKQLRHRGKFSIKFFIIRMPGCHDQIVSNLIFSISFLRLPGNFNIQTFQITASTNNNKKKLMIKKNMHLHVYIEALLVQRCIMMSLYRSSQDNHQKVCVIEVRFPHTETSKRAEQIHRSQDECAVAGLEQRYVINPTKIF